MRPWTVFAIALAASIAISAVLWVLTKGVFVFFLFLPLLFLWPRRRG